MMATDYTDGLALQRHEDDLRVSAPRLRRTVPTTPRPARRWPTPPRMAGMAFANAFLGVCHSMAHKLGAFHHLPHGVANALMIDEVLRFNAAEVPAKMGTFPQYDHPHTLSRYADGRRRAGPGRQGRRARSWKTSSRAIDELKEKIGIKQDHPRLWHRRKRLPRTVWTRWWSRRSTTSAPAPTRAIR